MSQIMSGNKERAERLMAIGQMAASLAHEIRNPLGSMELYCTLLKQDLSNAPESLHLAEQIHSNIKSLDRIISNCLQFTRDVKPNIEEIPSVRDYFNSVLNDAKVYADNANVPLKLDIDADVLVNADPYLLKQGLLNLILNAIDAVSEKIANLPTNHLCDDGPEGCVLINSIMEDPKCWLIEVIDHGIGIPEECRMQLFDPFFTTKANGTGLGLAIVHSIIRSHKGSIDVYSQENKMTKISIMIPQ